MSSSSRMCCVREEAGFTLLEVSVAVTLGLMIVGLAYGVYVTSTQFVSRWERQIQAENELHLFTRRFSHEVRTASGVRRETARGVALRHEGGDETVYRWEDGALLRNGAQVQLPGVEGSGTFVVQQVGGQAYVELRFTARYSGMAAASVSRSMRIGATTRLPIAWESATQPPGDSD